MQNVEQTSNNTASLRFVEMSDRQKQKYEIRVRTPRPLCNLFRFLSDSELFGRSLELLKNPDSKLD